MTEIKTWYKFAPGDTDGGMTMKNTLGGKGANLAEMCRLGFPVPPGFTLPTHICNEFHAVPPGKAREEFIRNKIAVAVKEGITFVESKTEGQVFGSEANPMLLSVRSGARASMPGMMDTILNCGLNEVTLSALIKKSGDERFALDCYRRFIQMYSDVVMQIDKHKLDEPFDKVKKRAGVQFDHMLGPKELRTIVDQLKVVYREETGKDFPEDPVEQLTSAVIAVFDSWGNKRAITYRKLNNIPEHWGTAANVQLMVFGNFGDNSGTGVAFSRDPATGFNKPFGEWLPNAQGEDVVAGIRTPGPLWQCDVVKDNNGVETESLEHHFPEIHKQLVDIMQRLEKHFLDLQDIEFTVQDGRLYMLQCRIGKRTPMAALKMAVDMVHEGLITERVAIMRITPTQLDQLMHPQIDPRAHKSLLGKGLAASPGAAAGQIVLSAEEAEKAALAKKPVILVREETSAEDVGGMHSAQGILTQTGGMTSHAAVVARGMGRPCICGCSALEIDEAKQTVTFKKDGVDPVILKVGDYITLDGSKGEVYHGLVKTMKPTTSGQFGEFLGWCDKIRKLAVYANADTPADAENAVRLGGQGIGLVRTEHMFFKPERILHVRGMILAGDLIEKQKQLDLLEPMQREDFEGIFKAMHDKHVSIRLLDPPLHEFLPKSYHDERAVAQELGITRDSLHQKAERLNEFNPMLGHRGCRLGLVYPEIYDMQIRAIITAAINVSREHVKVYPEIMVPLIMHPNELAVLKKQIETVAEQTMQAEGCRVNYVIGTMIELPRAALVADKIAPYADFFSFGTNDLTQTTMGLSRDDAGSFLPDYQMKGILPNDPFKVLDEEGVGYLVELSCAKGKMVKPNLRCGVCGEHGGDPESIKYCVKIGLDYVSCSPYRIPVARLAAAQAQVELDGQRKHAVAG